MKKLFNSMLPSLIFVCCSFTASSQYLSLDSLNDELRTQADDSNKVNTLLSIANELIYLGEYENSLKNCSTALLLSKKINFIDGEIGSLKISGATKLYMSKSEDALSDFSTALKIAEQSNNKILINSVNFLIAQTYLWQENYPEAIKVLFKCLKFDEEIGNKNRVAMTLMTIGAIYERQLNYPEAIRIYTDALRKSKDVKDEGLIADIYSRLGDIYTIQHNFSAALEADSTAYSLYLKLNNKRGIAEVMIGIGNVFEKEGTLLKENGDAINKFAAARDNYLGAQKIFTEINYPAIDWALLKLGNINIKLKNYPEARFYLEKALEIGLGNNSKEGIKENYLSLSILDSSLRDYKQAYNHYKLYILYRDSIINEANTTEIAQAKMGYEFEKKESAARVAQAEKDADAARTKSFQYMLIGGFLLLAIFLLWNNRLKQKAKRKIEKAYTKLKSTQVQLIQSEKMASLGELTAGIAHEIQNPLNFVNNFSELSNELIDEMNAELEKGDIEEAKAIAADVKLNLEKINHHGNRAGDIVKGMLQHTRISTGTKELTDINALADEFLKLSYHGLRAKDKSFNAEIKTDFDKTIGKINIIPQDIGRVLLNLYNNAFYAVQERQKELAKKVTPFEKVPPLYQPTVSIQTKKINGDIEIRVSDNGNGIPPNIMDKIFQPFFTTKPTGSGTGLGLSLSYDIVKAHGGEIKVESKEAEMTTFIIVFPP